MTEANQEQHDMLFDEIYRTAKILKRYNQPYWLTDKNGHDYTFEYPPEHKKMLEDKLDQLCKQWIDQHPNELLNGV